ncbi:hypothetical protein EZV62_003563 [Acer yangbiense]|uniref:Uncharacterized protein n=1 Tax=Acer yangbiense TaxID=1000413 RepID=A0A5C7IHN8_9ROSI|nr:hypothetical protein EZV62_003563 [Acer yangbiense]
MFQQRAESEGVQPNHHNYMPNSISEEPINRLPSNLGGSAHQSQLFYMPNSSLEEPIHQLPSNLGGSALQSDQFFPGSDVCYTVLGWLNRLLWKAITELAPSSNQGGSAHQPQLSEAQFLANELWRGLVQPNVNPGGRLSPTQSLGVQPNVNPGQSVPQDVNPGGRLSPTQSEDQFDIWTADGRNHYRPLYEAAQKGYWQAAISFIDGDWNVLTAKITALNGQTVLHVAACCLQWEFILNLLEHITSPESIAVKTDISGKTVLHYVAQGGNLKTAKALVQKNSNLLQIKDKHGCLPLFHSISSGNEKLVRYLSSETTYEFSSDPSFPEILRYLIISGYHVAYVEKVRHAKLKHEYAVLLVNHVCTQLSSMSIQEIMDFLQNRKDIMASAVIEGIEEIVRPLFQQFPDLINVQLMPEGNILQSAIKLRQVMIVNIIKEIFPTATKSMCAELMKSDQSTTLHLAGELAPQIKLLSVSGAALQIQRELQWFEVWIMSD